MHMTDALLSPAVGGVMTAVSVTAVAYAAKRTAQDRSDDFKIPMMGVMGAFVFAAQMVNFTIPGTGASGHIIGGVLLAAMLGPYAGLLAIASVLLIQCLLFADGGLLAYGCNLFNMGVCSCFLSYFLVYRPILRKGVTPPRLVAASVLASILALQAGAFGVVLETVLSGVTNLPFGTFTLVMQPIHLAVGLAEGLVTAAILCFVRKARPSLLAIDRAQRGQLKPIKRLLIVFAVFTCLLGGGLSLCASTLPDGLEWSVAKTAGADAPAKDGPVYDTAQSVVDTTAIMPDYALPGAPDSRAGTAAAGFTGSILIIGVAACVGILTHYVRKKQNGT